MGKPRHEPGPTTSALNHHASRQLHWGHENPAQHNGYRPNELNRYPLPGTRHPPE